MTQYSKFLDTKQMRATATGKPCQPGEAHPMLFPFQRDIVAWAVRQAVQQPRRDGAITICGDW